MTIFVTGGAGFIGSNFLHQAVNSFSEKIVCIDNLSYASDYENIKDLPIEFCNVNIIDEYYGDYIFEKYKPKTIFHFAAETHVDNSIVSSTDFVHSNINGVHNILELMRTKKLKVPTLIHFSTDEVYGDIVDGAHKETDLLKPSNPYSATKAAADQLILAWSRTYDIPYVIIRPTNNYGIGQYVEKLIPKACKCVHLGRKIPLHESGEPIRNWLHASDTADAVIKIIESEKVNEIYNISGNFEQKNITTVTKVLSYFGISNISEHVDLSFSRPGQDVRYCIDDSKLQGLGWKPKCSFDKELPSIVNYYKQNFIW